MDIFKMLKEDHQKVKRLFKQFEASDAKQSVAGEIFRELEIHTQVEEEIFYPAIEKAAEDEELEELVSEAYEEHRLVKEIIEELKELSAEDEGFKAKFYVLRENVEAHIEEEEDELFPLAKKALKPEIEEISEEAEERKEDLAAAAH